MKYVMIDVAQYEAIKNFAKAFVLSCRVHHPAAAPAAEDLCNSIRNAPVIDIVGKLHAEPGSTKTND